MLDLYTCTQGDAGQGGRRPSHDLHGPYRPSADRHLAEVAKYRPAESPLAVWMEQNIPDGLTVFGFPAAHLRLIRTTNGLERLNREIRRRTGVVSTFPNEAA